MRTHDKRREVIRNRVDYWARRLNVRPRLVRVRRMTQKWGSCSTSGIVTLASDLADRELSFQNFVIAHELLHLRVPNHGKLFKALMTAHVPGWKKHDVKKAVTFGSGVSHFLKLPMQCIQVDRMESAITPPAEGNTDAFD